MSQSPPPGRINYGSENCYGYLVNIFHNKDIALCLSGSSRYSTIIIFIGPGPCNSGEGVQPVYVLRGRGARESDAEEGRVRPGPVHVGHLRRYRQGLLG